jgi:hypothetical protein
LADRERVIAYRVAAHQFDRTTADGSDLRVFDLDRDVLVPDKAHQKDVWRILGRRGALLVDGEILGTWQAKAATDRLDVKLSPFVPLDVDMFAEEADRLATARGLSEARVS